MIHILIILKEFNQMQQNPCFSFLSDPSTINLAQNRPAIQTDTSHGGLAERAVDGVRSSQWLKGSCSHTNAITSPWWRVDLQYVVCNLNNPFQFFLSYWNMKYALVWCHTKWNLVCGNLYVPHVCDVLWLFNP